MDQQLIIEKLEALRRCIERVEQKCPQSYEELMDDPDLQDIVSVNLERAIQLCVDIGSHIIADSEYGAPVTMAETFDILHKMGHIEQESANHLKKAVGFRKIAVHTYQKINWEIVFNICRYRLDDFKYFARQVNTLLE